MAQSGARAGENSLKSANLAAGAAGRGVLERAFAILDALADSDQGLGLTALSQVSGLAKTTAYRLAEQLAHYAELLGKYFPRQPMRVSSI